MVKYNRMVVLMPPEEICKHKGHKTTETYNEFSTFDTETSNNHDLEDLHTWVYLWAWNNGKTTYYGEDINSFVEFFQNFQAILDNDINYTVYVHNLAYDFSYILPHLGKPDNALYIDTHKPLFITYGNIIFKCSYMLTNKSLDRLCSDCNIQDKKLTGAIDYNEIHLPNENFPKGHVQLQYIKNDVVSLHECIEALLSQNNDSILSIPFTSTGYIRRKLQNSYFDSLSTDATTSKHYKNTKMNVEEFKLLNYIFKGGYTHANFKHCNKHLKGSIRHRDFTSHYPTQLVMQKYPIECFRKVNVKNFETLKILHKQNCLIVRVHITNLRAKHGLHYISFLDVCKSKTTDISVQRENGRVINLQGEFDYTCTYEDLQIISLCYQVGKIELIDVYKARKDFIHSHFYNIIMQAFETKTQLKEVSESFDKNTPEYINAQIKLQEAKALLNGLYGLCATCPIKDTINLVNKHNNFNKVSYKKFNDEQLAEQLADYNKHKKNFLPYSYGVYVTAYARLQLYTAFNIIGFDSVIYADTDSAFYFSTDKIEQKLNQWNFELKTQAIERKAYTTLPNGNIVTLNQFSDENEDITDFKTLHSKCYLYTYSKKGEEITINTIAGVKKCKVTNENGKKVVHYAHEELGNTKEEKYKNFKSGFIFREYGGTAIKYTNNGGVIVNVNKTISDNRMIDSSEQIHELTNDTYLYA